MPTFHVPQHPLKGGALEIRAGIAIVCIAFRHGQLRMIFDILLQQLPLVADGIALHAVSVLPGQAAVQRGGQWSLLHEPLLSVNCPQILSRLCMGADQFQQQRFRCLLAKEIPGDGDRRGGCLLGARHKQTSCLRIVHRMRVTETVCLSVRHVLYLEHNWQGGDL